MTVQSTDRKAGPFFSGTILPFDFKVFSKEDIQVIWTSSAGVEDILVLDSEYSVTLNPDQDNTPGGSVTLSTAISGGANAVIIGDLAYDQGTDVRNQGGFEPETIEDALDRVTILVQQLLEMAKRTLRIPASSSSNISTQLPQPTAGNVLGWNGEANQLVNLSPQDIATTVAFGTAFVDQFEGNAVDTEFSLSANPALLANMDVQVDGVSLRNGIDFVLLAGAVIKFTTPPAAPSVPGEPNIQVRGTVAVPQGFDTADVVVTQLPESGLWTTVQGFINRIVSGIGASIVGYDNITLQDIADYATPLQNYTALRAYTGRAKAVRITGLLVTAEPAGIAGNFQRMDADTTSADNGGTIIVDALGRRWKRVPKGSGSDPYWFEAVGDGIADDSDAIEKTILAEYNSRPTVNGMKRGCVINFGQGTFRVAQPSKLFSSLPTQTGGAASFHFYGKGMGDGYASQGGATIIKFDPAVNATTQFLINNNSKIAWSKFHNIGFCSTNGGTFWNGPTGSGVQSFEFYQCQIRDFTDFFNVGATSNNSEWSFYACKFAGFSGKAFYFNNVQALNWRFYGCDAEVFSGTLFEYNQGTNVIWVGGSIIPTQPTCRIVKVTGSSATYGPGNSPNLLFEGVRWEMRAGLLLEKLSASAFFSVMFRDCCMGGLNIPTTPSIIPVINWNGGGKITFENCDGLRFYRFAHTVDGSSGTQKLTVKMDNCRDVDNNIINESTFAITGSTSALARKPLFIVNDCGRRFDGMYIPASSSALDINAEKRSISFSTEGRRIAIKSFGAGWPAIEDLFLPPVFLKKIEFYPVSVGGFGASTVTIDVKDSLGNTLATATWNMATPGAVVFATDVNKKLTETDNYLRFEFSSSYVGGVPVPFGGELYLNY